MSQTFNANALDVDALFRARGVQCTAQRKQVWQFFADHPQGHTVADAVEALRQAGIGQATVYRAVFLLLDLGLLCRLQDPVGKTCFIAVRPGHSHPLICRVCRHIVEFDACDLSVLERLLGSQTGYAIESHRLEVYGLCPACQGGRENNSQLVAP